MALSRTAGGCPASSCSGASARTGSAVASSVRWAMDGARSRTSVPGAGHRSLVTRVRAARGGAGATTGQQTRPSSVIAMFSVWPGAEGEPVGRIVAEQIDEDAEERVPEHESRRHRAGRVRSVPATASRYGIEQQILEAVVEHDRMPEPCGVRELDAPRAHRSRLPTIWPSMKLPMRPTPIRNAPGITIASARAQEGHLLPARRRSTYRDQRADEQAVRGHAAEPVGRNRATDAPGRTATRRTRPRRRVRRAARPRETCSVSEYTWDSA